MSGSILRSEALARGITDHRLHGPRWSRISYGLYTPRSREVESLASHCRAMAKVLPAGGGMAHLTAAQLHGLWLPRLPAWLPTLAVLPPGAPRPEHAGLYALLLHVTSGIHVVPQARPQRTRRRVGPP